MCRYCGSKDGCKPVGGTIGTLIRMGILDVEDFKQIYWFMKYVQLPFIHRVIEAAIDRKQASQS